jgi:hypothetical protein
MLSILWCCLIKRKKHFGERMIDLFKNNSIMPVSEFIDAIVNNVKVHIDSSSQVDNIACLILKTSLNFFRCQNSLINNNKPPNIFIQAKSEVFI